MVGPKTIMGRQRVVPIEPTWAKVRRWLKRIFHLSGVAALLWSFSIWIMVHILRGPIPPVRATLTSVDFESLVFGASSVALIIYSVMIGIVAFFGYDSLKRNTADEVQAALRDKMDMLDKELRGRVALVTGLILGIIHSTPDEQTEEERRGYLAEGVTHCEQAYKDLSQVNIDTQYTALNNLVYYSCALGAGYKREFLLDKAEELRVFSQKIGWIEGLLTYCRAILDLSEDPQKIESAYRIASGLGNDNLTERQRNEATTYVASLRSKRGQKKT
jgi:hypothetical protein